MPPRRTPTKIVTRIAAMRLTHGLTQREMAEATGIPYRTYRRIENGTMKNPGIRHLANIVIVLGMDPEEPLELDTVLEDNWLTWMEFPGGPKSPVRPEYNDERFR